MPISDLLDNKRTQTHADRSGEGALPAALLAALRDLGIGCKWTVQAQETQAGTFVQLCVYPIPAPPAAPVKSG